MYHLPMCVDCEKDFEFTPETGSLIVKQISRAMADEAKWSGYPQLFIDVIIARMEKTKLLRKAEPRDLKEN